MSPAWIRVRALAVTRRNPKGGKSYQVLYRRGGRGYPIETAGSFRTRRDANIRRDLVAGWLAAGLDPKAELAVASTAKPAVVATVAEWADRYAATRIDFGDQSTKNVRSHLKRIQVASLAAKAPGDVTVADVQETVSGWAGDLKPSSVRRYLSTLKLIFDFAGADPNPARDPRVKLPADVRVETNPPTADQFLQMLQAMPPRYWLPLVTLEQTGMRVGEAATLTWGDVDEAGARFRLRAGATKARRARWVQVPGWLMETIAETVAREDRTEDRRVFAGFNADVAKNAMARACRTAGLPHFHPHDLRHRRGTIWHHDPAVSIREQMERGGWSRSDIAIDTYSHLMPLDEVPAETLRHLLVMSR